MNPMTLAVAFRCMKDGFLLRSGREWNDSVSKRSMDKIYRIGNLAPCDFFIAGSGPEGILTKTWADIQLNRCRIGIGSKTLPSA
jgi:hypothetical protein